MNRPKTQKKALNLIFQKNFFYVFFGGNKVFFLFIQAISPNKIYTVLHIIWDNHEGVENVEAKQELHCQSPEHNPEGVAAELAQHDALRMIRKVAHPQAAYRTGSFHDAFRWNLSITSTTKIHNSVVLSAKRTCPIIAMCFNYEICFYHFIGKLTLRIDCLVSLHY